MSLRQAMERLRSKDTTGGEAPVPIIGSWEYRLTRTRWECGCTAEVEERLDGDGGGAIFSHCDEHKFGQGRLKAERPISRTDLPI